MAVETFLLELGAGPRRLSDVYVPGSPVPGVPPTVYQQRVVADGAAAYWPLDDASGTTARDLAGTRHGTISGGVTLAQPGIGGSPCMVFNGTTGKIDTPLFPGIVPTFSLEAWVKGSDLSGDRTVLGQQQANNHSDFVFQILGSVFRVDTIAAVPAFTSPNLVTGNWVHLVITGNGATARGYVNGVEVGAQPFATMQGPIGGASAIANFAGAQYFAGALQDLAIYPRALSSAEVAAHFAARTAPGAAVPVFPAPPADLDHAFRQLLLTADPENGGPVTIGDSTVSAGGPGIVLDAPPTAYQEQVVADGALAYWPLNEVSGTVAHDLAGDRDGTIAGGVTLGQPGVGGGKAMAFDGTTGKISTAALPPFTLPFSYEVWLFPTAGQVDNDALLFRGNSEGTLVGGLYLAPGPRASFYTNIGGVNVPSPLVLVLNAWSQLVAAWDGTTVSLYVNGVLSVASAVTLPADTGSGMITTIGWDRQNPTNYYLGRLQDVAVYPRALSPAEVAAHYSARLGLAPPPSSLLTGLVSYWKLDEASGTRLDTVGTNHFVPTNAPVGAPGRLGGACAFTRTSAQFLSHPDPQPLGDRDFTYTFWFRRAVLASSQEVLLSKDRNDGRSYFLTLESGSLRWFLQGAVTYSVLVNDTLWHFVVAGYNAATDTQFLQLDNGPVETAPSPSVTLAAEVPMQIGSRSYAGFEWYFDGVIDDLALYHRVLTPAERTELWNNGLGLPHPFLPPPPPPFPTAGLVSYWPLDESTGERRDVVGSNHLTPTGNPVGAPGKVGQGCDFEASSEQYLRCPSNASLQAGDTDFTIVAWVKLESAQIHAIVSKDREGGGFDYRMDIISNNQVRFFVNGALVNGPALSLGVWTLLIGWHDAAANTVTVQANDGVPVTVAGAAPLTSTEPFTIGAIRGNSTEGAYPADAVIDEVAFYRRLLTAAERTQLYNGGAGLRHPSVPVLVPASGLTLGPFDSGPLKLSHIYAAGPGALRILGIPY